MASEMVTKKQSEIKQIKADIFWANTLITVLVFDIIFLVFVLDNLLYLTLVEIPLMWVFAKLLDKRRESKDKLNSIHSVV